MIWFLAVRPKTLLASISPLLLGLGMAHYDGFSNLFLASIVLITAILIQIFSNYVNDYYDFKKGVDTKKRVGPMRALQSGEIQPSAMKKAILILFTLCLALGCFITYLTDYTIFIIGITSLFFAYAYTGGPYPLAYHALGEFFVFLFFGPIAVIASYYTQTTCCFTLLLGKKVFIASIGSGLLAVLILMVNNIRDYENDQDHNKNTLVVKLGLPSSKLLYSSIAIFTLSVPFLLIPHLGKSSLVTLAILPLLVISVKKVYQYKQPEELNQILALNSLNLFFFCVLLVSAKAIG